MSVVNHNHHYQTLCRLLNDLRGFRVSLIKQEAKGEGKAGVIVPQDVTPPVISASGSAGDPTRVAVARLREATTAENASLVTFPQVWVNVSELRFYDFASKNATSSWAGYVTCTTNGATRMVSPT